MRVQGPEKHGNRPGWLLLYIAIAVVLMTVWSREPDTGPLHSVRVGVHAVTAPIAAAGEWATTPVREFLAWAGDLGVSRSQLEQLRDQNEQLRSRVAELEEARLENQRLRALVKIVQAGDLQSIGAHVIGRPANSWEGVITIDRGSRDGVKVGMPIVGSLGLLGQTVQVSSGSSRVRLITDQRSGVAAMIQSSRAEGVVHGSIEGQLSLDFVSRETTVRAGDVVITSGLGGVFPKGILVGEVLEVHKNANALQQSITVVPASDPSSTEEVKVLLGAPPAAKLEGGE